MIFLIYMNLNWTLSIFSQQPIVLSVDLAKAYKFHLKYFLYTGCLTKYSDKEFLSLCDICSVITFVRKVSGTKDLCLQLISRPVSQETS
jgi:hypothetical protein